jgi:hypothetical protein
VGKLAVIFCLEALKRFTKSLNDHNGFLTLTLCDAKNKNVVELPSGLPQIPRSIREHIQISWASYRGCFTH